MASNLHYLRTKAGWTQEQLGEMLGVTKNAVGAYEKGRAYPKIDIYTKISQLFSVSMDDLCHVDLRKRETKVEKEDEILKRLLDRVDKLEDRLKESGTEADYEQLAQRLIREFPDVARRLGIDGGE